MAVLLVPGQLTLEAIRDRCPVLYPAKIGNAGLIVTLSVPIDVPDTTLSVVLPFDRIIDCSNCVGGGCGGGGGGCQNSVSNRYNLLAKSRLADEAQTEPI